jgi:hypothetical protein
MSNQLGRGHEPVTVVGSTSSFVAVNAMDSLSFLVVSLSSGYPIGRASQMS